MSAGEHKGNVHHRHLSGAFHDLKIGLVHKKHAWGKLANIVNRNHRHDEEHERITDEKRTKIAESHRFGSFAPERVGNDVKWFVDGRDYFWAVSEILENAKETIYIADWWLSPELFLRRPPYYNKQWRLDQVLKRKAQQGVKIYVMVYKEIEAALSCNSNHTKVALHNLFKEGEQGFGNIKVLRHPDHNQFTKGGDMTFYWAHHEKILVVDWNIACVGGLDLCFGRYDSSTHQLADVHPAGVHEEIWPGQDFNNNRVLDFEKVNDWEHNQLSKAEYGRMPWHDVHLMIIGGSVIDVCEHFVLRWNFIKRDKYKRDDTVPWLEMEGRTGEDEDLVGVQRPKHPMGGYFHHPISPIDSKNLANSGTLNVQVLRSSTDWSSGILKEHSIQTAYIHAIRNAKHFVYIENQFFISATGDQQKPIENTIGAAMVEAVVRAAKEGRKFRIIVLIPAVPGFAGDLRDDAAKGTRQIMDYQYKSICRGEHSIFEQIRKQGVDPEQHIFFFNLRAYDRLNVTPAVKKQEEESGVSYQEVQTAAAKEIMGDATKAEREYQKREKLPGGLGQGEHRKNPFVGRGHGHEHNPLKHTASNKSDDVDLDAIEKFEEARKDNEDKLPEGGDSVAKHAMLGSGNLSAAAFDGSEADEVDLWVQEELYIHGKILIADDEIVICGSANINDRSQLGDHDSEIAVYVEDTKKIQSRMDGQPVEVSNFASSLRRQLWREHLGILKHKEHDATGDPNAMPPPTPNHVDEDEHWEFVADPLGDELWELWTDRATTNTRVYREMFHADPDNYVKNFDDYDKYRPSKGQKAGHIFNRFTSAEDIRAKLNTIRGHLVWMPLEFLSEVALEDHNTGIEVNSYTQTIYT